MKKYIITLATILLAIPLITGAVQVTIPSAPGFGYVPISTSTGNYVPRPYLYDTSKIPSVDFNNRELLNGVGAQVLQWNISPTFNGLSDSANGLKSTVGVVNTNVSNPFAGQILTATDSTHATWQYPASSTAWTIGNGFIYNATSTDLVGIGSSTPYSTLSVSGKPGTNPFTVASSTGASLLSVAANGNVGIGTTTPRSNLTIQGSQYIATTTGGLILNSPDGTCHLLVVSNINVLTASTVTCP